MEPYEISHPSNVHYKRYHSAIIKRPNLLSILLNLIVFLCVYKASGQLDGMHRTIRGLGSVRGIRDASTNTYAYLGIPYAKAPVGNLRFMPPEPHNGWNTTLDATQFGSSCLQSTARGRTSEDCLFLNVWTPSYSSGQVRSRGPYLPVVIFIGGDLYTYFDASVYSGAELAAMGVIVVTFNYRLGVYGFFSMEEPKAGGNMGIWDQYLAIKWVSENIQEFGGDPSQITLMGHSSGAAAAMIHLTSPRAAGRFHRIILMSGSSLSPMAFGYRVKDASLRLSNELQCPSSSTDSIMDCIRYQDSNRISQAYYRVVDYYNGTDVFGPVIDNFLPSQLQYSSRYPWEVLESGDFPKVPVITGLSAKDGLMQIKRKPQLYRMGPGQLKETFENEIIPQLLERTRLSHNYMVVKEVVKFAFITGSANETSAVMDQLLDFFTEAYFLAPHISTARYLSRQSNPVYAYVFDQETPDPNVYSRSVNSTGAWHGSILLYLFGRQTFTDVIGRDFNGVERSVSNRVQELWVKFIKSGVPALSRGAWPSWSKFNPSSSYHLWLRDGRVSSGYLPHRTIFWTQFLPKINHLGTSPNELGEYYVDPLSNPQQYKDVSSTYKSATWILVGLVMILMMTLLLVISVLRRRRQEQEFTSRETTPEVNGSRSPIPSPSPHPNSTRRLRNQDQGVTILY